MALSMLLLRAHLRRLMYVSTLLISLALTLYGGSLCAQGAEPTPPVPLDVKIERGTLTVNVHNAPLAQVLRVIGERAGIQVTVRGDVSGPVTQSFAGVPLDDGIKRLTQGYSLVLIHAAAGKSKAARLTRVWVLGGTSTPRPSAAAANT